MNGLLDLAGLGGIQAAQPLSDPLSSLDEEKRKAAILAVASKLINHIDLIGRTPRGLLDQLTKRVDKTLREANANTTDVEPIASGDFSIFFKARQRDDDVSIKALVQSPSRGWLAQDYVKRANVVKRMRIPRPSPSGTSSMRRRSTVSSRTTCRRRRCRRCCAGTARCRVRLSSKSWPVVRLAGHVHAMEGGHLVGPVRPSHVYYDADLKNRSSR